MTRKLCAMGMRNALLKNHIKFWMVTCNIYETFLLFSYSSMIEQWLERRTKTSDLRVSLCPWLVSTAH